jgi:hypothetical protein
LGGEEGIALGSGLCYEQKKERKLNEGFTVHDPNFIINFRWGEGLK